MKVLFCWAQPSGYLTACLRELSRRPGLQVRFLGLSPGARDNAPFDRSVVDGIDAELLGPDEAASNAAVRAHVRDAAPDVLVIAGWFHRPYVRLLSDPAYARTPLVLCADTPLRFGWRQRIAPLKIGRLLRRANAIVVPGERAFQAMRYWGVPSRKLRRGMYGFDFERLASVAEARERGAGGWPRRFLFVGRLVASKGVDVLVEAYRHYRSMVPDPWPLTICGTGPLEDRLRGDGIELTGFVQPSELPALFARAGVFVLPSREDPWGVVLGEATAASLPIVCTHECGAAAELVRDRHNGLLVPAGDPDALARALATLHVARAELPVMGRAGRQLASAYSAQRWADRWSAWLEELPSRG